MKLFKFFPLALFFPALLMAQKEINDPNAEARNVKGFHAVKVSTGIQLVLTQGTSEAVAVSARRTGCSSGAPDTRREHTAP